MPYRRLPNTDLSRIKALKTAIEKAGSTDFQHVAISMRTLSRARSAVSKFERLCLKYQQTLDTQVKANIAFQNRVKNARMYISHFIQVLYMCVMRAEIKPELLELYGLQKRSLILPDLSSNEQLLQWGQQIIAGENRRIAQGGVPIYNPGIAKVKVMYTLFKEGYQTQHSPESYSENFERRRCTGTRWMPLSWISGKRWSSSMPDCRPTNGCRRTGSTD